MAYRPHPRLQQRLRQPGRRLLVVSRMGAEGAEQALHGAVAAVQGADLGQGAGVEHAAIGQQVQRPRAAPAGVDRVARLVDRADVAGEDEPAGAIPPGQGIAEADDAAQPVADGQPEHAGKEPGLPIGRHAVEQDEAAQLQRLPVRPEVGERAAENLGPRWDGEDGHAD